MAVQNFSKSYSELTLRNDITYTVMTRDSHERLGREAAGSAQLDTGYICQR